MCWAGMGKGGNCVVVKLCDKEHTLNCVKRVEGRRTIYPGSSQDLLYGNVYVCIGFQCKE